MKKTFLLSTTPAMESGVQVQDDNYIGQARLEGRAFKEQLFRTYGKNPTGSTLTTIRSATDYNTYIELRFSYDDENQRHVSYLARLEKGCQYWDKQAKRRLKKNKYSPSRTSFRNSHQDDMGYTSDNGPTGHGDICWSDADPGL